MSNTVPTPENPGAFNWFLICFLGVIWGSAFMSISVALQEYPPFTLAALRVFFGAIVLCIMGVIMGQPITRIHQTAGLPGWGYSAIIGFITVTAPFLLLCWGIQYVPSAFAGVAMGAIPLIILPLAYIFSPDEGIGPRRIIGVVLGFAGLALLLGKGALETTSAQTFWGQLACLAAAACYAVGSIITRRAPRIPPVAFASGTLAVGAAMLIPFAIIAEGMPRLSWSFETLTVFYLAALPTGLAAAIRVIVVQSAGSVFMSLTSYQVPIWSAVFGIVLLGEALSAQLFIALALILLGIGISQWRSLVLVAQSIRSKK